MSERATQQVWFHGRRLLALVVVAGIVALALIVAPATHAPPARAVGQAVHYNAGWHLVAAPSGSVLGAMPGTLYAYGPVSDGYQAVAPDDLIGGRGYWAYFGRDTDVTLDATTADYTRTILPAGHFAIVGNPSATQSLPIDGADVALAYDTAHGYTSVRELAPGQAAWVFSAAGSDITVGRASSQAGADQLRALQADLTRDASNLIPLGKLPGIADQFLRAHDYAMVQTAMDDVRAAFGDGLLVERAADQPALSAGQHDAELEVRRSVVQAQTAASAGDNAAADRAITAGQTAAQLSEDEAAAIARSSGVRQSLLGYAGLADEPAYTPQSLARYGDLCNGTIFALGLSLTPSDAFVGLVLATLHNQPPPAPVPPAMPTPSPTATSRDIARSSDASAGRRG